MDSMYKKTGPRKAAKYGGQRHFRKGKNEK
jgi:hypothetical protein